MQIQELKGARAGSAVQLRSSLLDPAVNLLIEHMRRELDKAKSTLEETQNELSAWKFTPDRLLLILESRLWCRRDDDGRQWTRVGAPTASVFCASRRYSTCWCPSLSDGVGVGCLPTKGPE